MKQFQVQALDSKVLVYLNVVLVEIEFYFFFIPREYQIRVETASQKLPTKGFTILPELYVKHLRLQQQPSSTKKIL